MRKRKTVGEIKQQIVEEQKDVADLRVMEEAGMGFDPQTQHLDLSKDEKRRVTSLMMGITAYRDLIIKDAEYLKVAADLADRSKGPAIRPATIDGILNAAIWFDEFISGKLEMKPTPNEGRTEQVEVKEPS